MCAWEVHVHQTVMSLSRNTNTTLLAREPACRVGHPRMHVSSRARQDGSFLEYVSLKTERLRPDLAP